MEALCKSWALPAPELPSWTLGEGVWGILNKCPGDYKGQEEPIVWGRFVQRVIPPLHTQPPPRSLHSLGDSSLPLEGTLMRSLLYSYLVLSLVFQHFSSYVVVTFF